MEQETEAGHETFCPAGLTRPGAPAGLIEGHGARDNLAATGLDMFGDGVLAVCKKDVKRTEKGWKKDCQRTIVRHYELSATP